MVDLNYLESHFVIYIHERPLEQTNNCQLREFLVFAEQIYLNKFDKEQAKDSELFFFKEFLIQGTLYEIKKIYIMLFRNNCVSFFMVSKF